MCCACDVNVFYIMTEREDRVQTRYHILMTEELKSSLKEIAKSEGRTLAATVTLILSKYVEEKKNA